ncbi:MAG: hypothetical protein ACRDT0_15700 [Pseudonocardiaceae bacterium]
MRRQISVADYTEFDAFRIHAATAGPGDCFELTARDDPGNRRPALSRGHRARTAASVEAAGPQRGG